MQQYAVKTYDIPPVEGISEKAMEIHLGLYAGYVKHLNAHYDALRTACEQGGDPLVLSALTRRIGFELAGIINHERFFETLEGGSAPCGENSALHVHLTAQFGSVDNCIAGIRKTAETMRGIGWILLVYDKEARMSHILWVSDHELGNVNLPALLAVDMWEHAYLPDYEPKNKLQYVDAYLKAVNWKKIEEVFDAC